MFTRTERLSEKNAWKRSLLRTALLLQVPKPLVLTDALPARSLRVYPAGHCQEETLGFV